MKRACIHFAGSDDIEIPLDGTIWLIEKQYSPSHKEFQEITLCGFSITPITSLDIFDKFMFCAKACFEIIWPNKEKTLICTTNINYITEKID